MSCFRIKNHVTGVDTLFPLRSVCGLVFKRGRSRVPLSETGNLSEQFLFALLPTPLTKMSNRVPLSETGNLSEQFFRFTLHTVNKDEKLCLLLGRVSL